MLNIIDVKSVLIALILAVPLSALAMIDSPVMISQIDGRALLGEGGEYTPKSALAQDRITPNASSGESYRLADNNRQDHSAQLVARGVFTGQTGHPSKGEVFLMKTPRDYVVILSYEFSITDTANKDGLAADMPSAKIGFGRDGQYMQQSEFATLQAISGRQTYIIPKHIAPRDYNELYIWSEARSLPISVATLR